MPYFNVKRYLSPSEIGIFLSHVNFLLEICKNNIPVSLIMEDDAYFDDEHLSKVIKNIISTRLTGFEYVSLFKHPKQKEVKKYLDYDNDFHRIDARSWGAVSYLITLEGAKKILSSCSPIKYPWDYTINNIMEKEGSGLLIKNSPITLYDNKTFVTDGDPYSRKENIKIHVPDVKKKVAIEKIDKFYIVSIERSYEKRQENIDNLKKIIKRLYNKDVCVMGVDGRQLTSQDIEKFMIDGVLHPSPNADPSLCDLDKFIYMKKFRRFLKAGEIGCYLSAIKIWQDILENDIQNAMVLEDDVKVNIGDFENNIEIILRNAPKDFTSISFFKNLKQKHRSFIEYDDIFHMVDCETWSTMGLIISNTGAKRLINNTLPIEYPLDYSIHKYGNETQSSYLYKNIFCEYYDDISVIDASNVFNSNDRIYKIYIIGNKNINLPQLTDICKITPHVIDLSSINVELDTLCHDGVTIKNGKVFISGMNGEMTQNELKEYLAHVSIWKNIMDERRECCLIINSNAVANNPETLAEQIKITLENSPPLFNQITLSRNNNDKLVKCNEFFHYSHKNSYGLGAYILNYKGAEYLLEYSSPIRDKVDDFVHGLCSMNKTGYMTKFPLFS